ncbi:hypothetical protein AADZ90_007255 [Aestuariibius sp. 2305UL40-4]|uniref:hypothetical protein n=1 Tax=Aestuariibius violaceus TaxID=3234132 RepID=UPI00345ECBEF
MTPAHTHLLLRLRKHRESRASLGLAQARARAAEAAKRSQDARLELEVAIRAEFDRKGDAYRTLPGQRITAADLELHERQMEALEAVTAHRRQELDHASDGLRTAHAAVETAAADLRTVLRNMDKLRTVADCLLAQRLAEQANREARSTEDETTDLFVLSALGGVS